MSRKEYTNLDRLEAIRLYATGLSIRGVAEEMGISRSISEKWITESGTMRTRAEAVRSWNILRSGRYYPGLEARARELYKSGLSTNQIADILKVRSMSVSRWVKGLARTVSEGKKLRHADSERDRAILDGRIDEGLTYKELGRRLGMSETAVGYHCRRLGI